MENISNQELRKRLIELGYNPPPVTDTSRVILLKKLKILEVNRPTNGDASLDKDKYELKSRKTRSAVKTQELLSDKTDEPDYSYQNFGLNKPLPRQSKSSKTIEDDFRSSYDEVDSSSNSSKRNKTSTPNIDSYSVKTRDPFEKGSDSEDAIPFTSRTPNSSLARKPLNTRRESEYYSSVRTPSSTYHKFDSDGGVPSYLNRDVYRSKLYNNNPKVNRWSKFISKMSLNKIAPTAVLILFVLFFVIVAVIYFSKNDRSYGDLSLDEIKYHKCSERPRANSPCIPDNEVEGSLKCLKTVYQALWKNEANKVCGNRKTSTIKNSLTPENVTELLVTENLLLRYEAEKMINNMELLVNTNPHLNINYAESEGFRLDNAELPWQCAFRFWFSSFFDYAFYLAAAIPLLYSMHTLFRWGIRRHEEGVRNKQDLIKGILEILQQNAIANQSQNYLPIVHVRDQLITYEDRERKKKLWAEAVKYVEENESRIRKEVQPFQGEDYDVWRWVGGHHLSLPKPKTWHGEAFETSKDTMNTPSTSPTPCLKIRNMFDPKNETANDDWVTGVKDAILERCEGVNVIHMVVEETNPEGCVYIKCASTDDAGKAYRRMHGAWFDGKIVSVKYLRLERYHERFPSSVGLNKPLIPSNDQKRSIV